MTPFFPCSWQDDPDRYVYLGSETNPRSRRKYDYYAVRTDNRGDNAWDWSATARHGTEDPDYGRQPLFVAWYDTTHTPAEQDFIFGLERARTLTLYYLATGKKPLLGER